MNHETHQGATKVFGLLFRNLSFIGSKMVRIRAAARWSSRVTMGTEWRVRGYRESCGTVGSWCPDDYLCLVERVTCLMMIQNGVRLCWVLFRVSCRHGQTMRRHASGCLMKKPRFVLKKEKLEEMTKYYKEIHFSFFSAHCFHFASPRSCFVSALSMSVSL